VRFANLAFRRLERISRHKAAMCLLAMLLPIAFRIALLPRIPIPQPRVPDEFSYLLGAETFASGHLTNPVHPMWVHFETLMELMQPTYMSKYPPGQSLFLALGWKLGNPWFGVLISFGLFSACLCWMLQNWVPPVYAVLGTVITLARISVRSYWMDSYWGGAVAAIAGCLVLGSLPRLAHGRVKSGDAALAAIGLVLLAISRPYEGLVMSVAVLAALLFWRRKRRQNLRPLFSLKLVAPLVLICGSGALLYGYYNYRVTGSPVLMPYNAYVSQYQMGSPWIIFPEHQPPVYRHADIENSWREQEWEYRQNRTHPLHNLKDLYAIFTFFCTPLYLFPVAVGLLLSSSFRLWTAAFLWACVWGSLLIESIKAPHYVAAGVGLLPLLVVYGLRWLRVIGGTYGPLLVLALVALVCAQGSATGQGHSWETGRVSPRMTAAAEATRQAGRHLILVRYAPDHIDKGDECVYNSADIDSAEIVWARDMGETKNQELLDYYRGTRKVWLYRPDSDPGRLIPYESAASK